MIPKHCIKIFKSKFTYYPNIIAIDKESIKVDLKKFLSKSLVIWFHDAIDNEKKRIELEKFVEYDSMGIMIYINRDGNIFILTTGDRKSVSDYIISNLIK